MRQLLLEVPFLLAALAGVLALGVLFSRSTTAAVWALVGTVALTHTIVPPIQLQVTQGGITIYALDIVTALMLVVGVSRFLSRPGPRSISLPLVVLLTLFMIHAVRGVEAFGLPAGVNGARTWLYVLGPLLFASHARPRWKRESFVPLLVGAAGLAMFALLQVARNGLYGANEVVQIGGELVDARPVGAAGALLIVQCLLLAAAGRFVRSNLWWVAIASMGAATLLLQHRTIWVIALLCGALAYLRWARVAIHVNERAAAGVASALLLFTPVVVALTASSSAFAESFRSATGQNSTLEWRTESWTTLVEANSSTEDRLIGLPAGWSSARRIDDRVATQSAHSVYVEALLNFGVLGPLIIAWLWFYIVRHRRTAAAALGISTVAVVLVIVSQALFGITNGLDPFQGLLLGMLVQAAWFGRDDEYRRPLGPRPPRFASGTTGEMR